MPDDPPKSPPPSDFGPTQPSQPKKDANSGPSHGKFGAFLAGLAPSKKAHSAGTVPSDDEDSSTNPPTISDKPSSELLQVEIQPHASSQQATTPKLIQQQNSLPKQKPLPTAPVLLDDSQAFKSAVAAAQDRVDKLNTLTIVLGGVATAVEAVGDGAAWVPGVGIAVKLVVTMLDSAKSVSMGKVAALRLVRFYRLCARGTQGLTSRLSGLQRC